MTKKLFFCLTLFSFLQIISSCSEEKKSTFDPIENNQALSNADSTRIKEELRKEKRRKMLERNSHDSLRMEHLLSEIIEQIEPSSFQSTFSDSLSITIDNSYQVEVQIQCDFLIKKNQRNLLIRRFIRGMGLVEIDLFSVKSEKPKRILHHEIWDLTYTNDTLCDVNGDGLSDLVVNGYGASGCCLKAFSEVFLVKKDVQSFSPKFHFINPTFTGHDGTIRGVCYGHIGETELYKFKWRNYEIDTIEYVSFARTKSGKRTGKVIVSNQYPGHEEYEELRIVSTIPKEYLSIKGVDWFANEL